ncbi:hypothetical protein AHiyo8_46940 [Arthrobacter sp. Hiyo8]|nr:hypothetical protein AHiyo8_46940 [Arthrobacter sp. Hiyo8]
MTLCYAGTAALGASVTCLLQEAFGYAPFFYWAAIWAHPLTALTVAVLRAAERRRRRHEVRLASSLNEQLKLADRAQQKLLHTRRRVARILHTKLQGNLVSNALALSRPGGNNPEEDLARRTSGTSWRAPWLPRRVRSWKNRTGSRCAERPASGTC